MTDLEAFVSGLISGMISRYRTDDINLQVVNMDIDEGMTVRYDNRLLRVKVDEIAEEDVPLDDAS